MEPIIGTIYPWAADWAPENYLLCNGQTLNIQQYEALYSIIGIVFGGNGSTTFCLPDLRGRVPVGVGQGTGLSLYQVGNKGGVAGVSLTVAQMPAHTHSLSAMSLAATTPATYKIPAVNADIVADLYIGATGTTTTPGSGAVPSQAPDLVGVGCTNEIYAMRDGSASIPASVTVNSGQNLQFSAGAASVSGSLATTGSGTEHSNIQPFIGINYIIAVNGMYPSFSQ